MLTRIQIKEYLLMESLDLAVPNGFVAITGETGAGKSILLKALGLALGERADASAVRTGAEQAVIAVHFETNTCDDLLAEQGLPVGEPGEDMLSIRRVVGRDGKSKAFVNNEPVAASFLKKLGPKLGEIQGQFASKSLLEPAGHGQLLDHGSGLTGSAKTTSEAYYTWQDAEAEVDACNAAFTKAVQDREYLEHAAAELTKLAPEPGEEEHLAERRQQLMQWEQTQGLYQEVLNTLNPKGDTDRRVVKAQQQLASCRVESDDINAAMDAMENASIQLGEAQSALESLLSNSPYEEGDASLEQTEERLFTLRDAARKYRVSLDDLPKLQQQMKEQLELIANFEATLAKATQAAATAKLAFKETASTLSEARQTAATKLTKALNKELASLKLPKAKFRVALEELPFEHWGAFGAERVMFMVQTNPGLPEGAVHKIASGGELARLLLALKVALVSDKANTENQPLMVFDEVDAGTGGSVATAIGERLLKLSKTGQVAAITHAPQVAALADQHWRIGKVQSDNGTVTTLTVLSAQERQEELARMLSGASVTDAARASASELLSALSA